VKRSDKDEPMWFAIHKCTDSTLGSSLHNYLYLKLAKIVYICLFYYLLSSLFNKIRGQEGVTGSAQKLCGGLVIRWEEGGGGPNNVYTCK
jgi:hypothetical protein